MTTVGSIQGGLPVTTIIIGMFVYNKYMYYYFWEFSVIVSAVIVVIFVVVSVIFMIAILYRAMKRNGICNILNIIINITLILSRQRNVTTRQ